MSGQQTSGQMEIFENGPNTYSDRIIETVTRYRIALVREEDTPYGDVSLTSPGDVAHFLNRLLADRPQEHMVAIYLDTRNRLIGWTIAHIGTINRAAVEPRTIFQIALTLNAAGLILSHNHPSGDPSPSAEDLGFTQRMAQAGEIVGIRLLDHLILGHDGAWTSLRERGGW